MSIFTMSGVTTGVYRASAIELLGVLNSTSTEDEVNNGFKCLTLMWLALEEDKEFDKELVKWKKDDNRTILDLVTQRVLLWKVNKRLEEK